MSERPTRERSRAHHAFQWLCVCAMLTAAEIVLNRFLSINTHALKIGFSFVPPMLAAMLYGPASASVVWALADFIGALLFPIGPYHPGFTAVNACMGVCLGLALYRREKASLPRLLIPILINCLVFGLGINTYWISTLYGSKTYWGHFLYRLPEYAVMIPVQLAVAPALLKLSVLLRRLGFVLPAGHSRGV